VGFVSQMKIDRISWEQYALELAKVASLRSEDPRTKVGCCLLRHDHTVASLGYNGAPAGVEIDWNNREEKHKRVVHAEINALRMVKPNEVYLAAITHACCNDCLKSLAAYGIKVVVYAEDYVFKSDYSFKDIAKEFGIKVIQIN
jgi:dCMP deaminase